MDHTFFLAVKRDGSVLIDGDIELVRREDLSLLIGRENGHYSIDLNDSGDPPKGTILNCEEVIDQARRVVHAAKARRK